MRRISGPERKKGTEEQRGEFNEELRDSETSRTIIWVMKLRRMGWAGNVARLGEDKNAYIFLIRRPEGKRPFGRGLNVKINLNRIVEG